MPNFTPIRFSHELDAAWIIALWLAIHGGDPSPEHIAFEAIAALSSTLAGQTEIPGVQTSFGELQSRLKEIGADMQQPAKTGAGAEIRANIQINRTYCFVWKGQRICITLPVVKLPTPG